MAVLCGRPRFCNINPKRSLAHVEVLVDLGSERTFAAICMNLGYGPVALHLVNDFEVGKMIYSIASRVEIWLI